MCELLEIAKSKSGLSYYGIAKVLNVSDQVMNKWKNEKSQPNGVNTLKLAKMAGLTTDEALKIVEGGFASLSLLIVTGFASTLAIAGLVFHQVCILCKIKYKLNNAKLA